jgi:hypothetical protein
MISSLAHPLSEKTGENIKMDRDLIFMALTVLINKIHFLNCVREYNLFDDELQKKGK